MLGLLLAALAAIFGGHWASPAQPATSHTPGSCRITCGPAAYDTSGGGFAVNQRPSGGSNGSNQPGH